MLADAQIVLFDGECVLCNGFANFIIDRNKKKLFLLGTLQEAMEKKELKNIVLPESISTIVLVKNQEVYTRSTAALIIIGQLPYWQWVKVLFVVPRFIRDAIYQWVAKNRYKWFGVQACRIPTKQEREHFL